MKIKVGLFGGSGKMGKAVEQMIVDIKTRHELIPFLYIGENPSDVFALSSAEIKKVENDILSDIDVWVDFSSASGLLSLLKATEKFKTPVVSGSTGLAQADSLKLKRYSQKRKIFWASNMSPGLWAFRQSMKGLKNISNFDFAIEEIHHTQKKDKPSGTAKTLHADLEKITNKKIDTPISLRLGGVFGVHTLTAASSNEVIVMQHQALNRTVFAEGALLACSWLINQRPGLYSMDDMFLNLKK